MLMFGRYTNATARAQQEQGCFAREGEPDAQGTHRGSVSQHLLRRVVITSSLDSPRKGKRVSQVQDPSRTYRQEQQKVGLEAGLEMRLQQRSELHLRDGARDRYTYQIAQVRREGPNHQEHGWSSWTTEKRVHGWRSQGRLHRALKTVASRYVINDLGLEREVSGEE